MVRIAGTGKGTLARGRFVCHGKGTFCLPLNKAFK